MQSPPAMYMIFQPCWLMSLELLTHILHKEVLMRM